MTVLPAFSAVAATVPTAWEEVFFTAVRVLVLVVASGFGAFVPALAEAMATRAEIPRVRVRLGRVFMVLLLPEHYPRRCVIHQGNKLLVKKI
jgi:hypothetical protein